MEFRFPQQPWLTLETVNYEIEITLDPISRPSRSVLGKLHE